MTSSLERVTLPLPPGGVLHSCAHLGVFSRITEGELITFLVKCARDFFCWMCRYVIFSLEQKLCCACRSVYEVLNKRHELEIHSLA